MKDQQNAIGRAHDHIFLGVGHKKNERKTWAVIALCGVMMVIEIVGGSVFGSLALVADGWHMSTHAGAMLIAALAYTYARRHANDPRFCFGTGQLGDLAGFTSAIVLAMIALLIGYEAVTRLLSPVSIRFAEAIPIAVIGLGVNIISAWLLSDDHQGHSHGHHHDHGGEACTRHGKNSSVELWAHTHRDNNIRSAYLHVMADAAVSVLAIVGLILARTFGWLWMDPVAGIVGALVIVNWSWTLMRDTAGILLDVVPDTHLQENIRQAVEEDGGRVTDLHLWRLGPGHLGVMLSVETGEPQAPDAYRARLAHFPMLSHITAEVHPLGNA